MAEKPIIFNTEMVRAILEGRKTQTRRPVKLQPKEQIEIGHDGENWHCYILKEQPFEWKVGKKYWRYGAPWGSQPDFEQPFPECPYGQVGDVLYVRETWKQANTYYGAIADYKYIYKAGYEKEKGIQEEERWHPSVHMPREAARLFLKVTDVRVERLQEITYNDCLREGMWNYGTDVDTLAAFQELWQNLNAKKGYGWETNCWVWVVEFEKIT